MTGAAAPKVSVLIPCYNLGRYLDEAVDSVLAQTCQNFEILIVDDGSTDSVTQGLLDGYARPKTRVIRTPHGGLAVARNLAIANTTGDYLCALDADDRLEPTYFEKAVRVLDSDPAVTFVSAWLRAFGDEEWDWKPERCDLPALLYEDPVLTAALVRREAVVAVGGYDTVMPVQGDEDWDLWLTLAERGYRGVVLREVLFGYRRRPDSMSTVAWYGPGHLPLAKYRVAKHRETYQAHLTEVLSQQDAETAPLLRANDEIEREIGSRLEPALAARRTELERLRARLAPREERPALVAQDFSPAWSGGPGRSKDLRHSGTESPDARHEKIAQLTNRVRDLEAGLQAASAEVTALRTSMSWRITAPLRALCGRWLRWRRPE